MSRFDCISNRNFKILASYISSKNGDFRQLFEDLPYPSAHYSSPKDFFLNEDEWTTYENFEKIFRRAREMVDEPYFYFVCGASSGELRSWGRFNHFVRIFASPSEGFKKLPFFNKNFNDTKEIEIIFPPLYDRHERKVRCLLKIEFHGDIDPNKDYIGDPFLRGILSSIPTIWGKSPALIRQPLNPYDPVVLFNEEPEFAPYMLDVKMEGDLLTLTHPSHGRRTIVGEEIYLQKEDMNGQELYLGKYTKKPLNPRPGANKESKAILITETVQTENRILMKEGEIFMAPYFILEVSYDRFTLLDRFQQIFQFSGNNGDSDRELIETIEQLRRSIKAKNEAFQTLEKINAKLKDAKVKIDEHAKNLEQKVKERTSELRKAQKDLLQLNSELESRVNSQIVELERYNELRRYLSPKLTETIMASGDGFGAESKRKLMTVVFSDIRGFSNLTDSLEPEELFHLMDRYLTEMITIVHNYDGTLNKIIGDGLLIFFGDPIPTEDHAEQAVSMAIDMQKKVMDLREEWLEYGHELGVGIGINTGYMNVGNIGSNIHKDYTVIGNQVNIASRLESTAKAGEILISQRTYSKVSNTTETEEMGDIVVKGISTPVKTYKIKVN